MIRRPPRSTRTDTLFPYTPLFRSVITVSHTVVATVAAIELTGATPVLVDVDHYWTLDPDRLEALLANWPAGVPKAKALIPVHLYGQPAAMPALQAIADRPGPAVLEDNSQDHGAKIGGRTAGPWG